MVQIVRKDCAAGLWGHLKDQFADLKATVMDAIMDIVQSQVIQAGIKFVLGLLTPVGAFIKAAMAIIDVVKFFIQRAAQIMELVKAFTDSIKAIASGNVGAVAKSIENALGRAAPVLIGFLASLLRIGGLADKVLGVIRKIRQRIENAIVKFWNFVKGKAKGLLGKIGVGKKEKDNKGKAKNEVDDKEVDLTTLRIPVRTKTDGNHTLYLRKEKKGYKLIMESTPTFYSDFINQIETTEENKYDKDKALIIAKRLDVLLDPANDKKDAQEINEKLVELSKFTVKIIDLFNLKPLQPDNDYKRGKKHGITWQKSDVILEFKKDLKDKGKTFPLGKWGSKKDLDYAGKLAAILKVNEFRDFPIMPGSTSTVYYVDGSESKPDRIRLRRNIDNKTFHGFPIDSNTAEKIFKKL